jgi:hypothetical protein
MNKNRLYSRQIRDRVDREKTQKNVDLHFAVESQIHSSSVAPQE